MADRDSFYLATVSASGWPYLPHRGGPSGFVKVLDENTLAVADFAGRRQYISLGNLSGNDRASLFFMDYTRRTRLKLIGHLRAEPQGQAGDLLAAVSDPACQIRIERVMLVDVVAMTGIARITSRPGWVWTMRRQ